MPVHIFNRGLAEQVQAERQSSPSAFRDEVWEGDYVVLPDLNTEHQELVGELITVLGTLEITHRNLFPGVNLSDRAKGWTQNYRIPDLALFLEGTAAIDHETHWQGGPDFLVEILSEDDPAVAKLDFYASIGVREALYIHRDPWQLDLYRNEGGKLVKAATSTLDSPDLLVSQVIPASFRLVANESQGRPEIEVLDASGSLIRRI